MFYNPRVMSKAAGYDAIRSAFERHELFLAYQPIVSLGNGRYLGAEALARWRQPDGHVLDASEFMPVTDRTPLSGLITYWVIDTVAVELGGWLPSNPSALVAINVPPEILGRGGLEYAARKSGLRERSRQIVLEITERGVPDQLGLDALNSVPATGARVALDDVTLSGANLALLMRCHFDFVKLDQGLVHQLGPDAGSASPAWLDGLASLLKSTQLEIIAEGVESAAQAEILRTAGVKWGQGRHLAPPADAAAFMRDYEARQR
jgi:sensor c-di-GMP phosphodiesterase-like protein